LGWGREKAPTNIATERAAIWKACSADPEQRVEIIDQARWKDGSLRLLPRLCQVLRGVLLPWRWWLRRLPGRRLGGVRELNSGLSGLERHVGLLVQAALRVLPVLKVLVVELLLLRVVRLIDQKGLLLLRQMSCGVDVLVPLLAPLLDGQADIRH